MPPHLRLVQPPKVLHIAFNQEVVRSAHRGVVYDPEHIFDEKTLTAKYSFEEFFQPGRQFRLCLLETDLRPGEVVAHMSKRFNATLPPSGEYNVIAHVEAKPGTFENLWLDLLQHPERWRTDYFRASA